MRRLIPAALVGFIPAAAEASTAPALAPLGATDTMLGLTALGIFVVAYGFVMAEEFIHMRKSKPVILAAGLIWIIVGVLASRQSGGVPGLEENIRHNLFEYAALFLFLLVAMTYINAMTERGVFSALRGWLVGRAFSYRQLFWITGLIAFFLSPVADNLTTALLLGAVLLAVGADSPRFVSVGCINIVVAANAGGSFSPFGDITTLMVWQSGNAHFFEFFNLFLPALTNFLVPATIMHFAVPSGQPVSRTEKVTVRRGAFVICMLFFGTIATAVGFEQLLHLPPFLGMMTGLSYLMLYSWYLKMTAPTDAEDFGRINIFNEVAQSEWDTLLFFFGVIFCVGGLGHIGYLEMLSHGLYDGYGATVANVSLGLMSAVIDNIPVMFAILTMNPEMDLYQWLLVTLTCGVGGSLLSIGSAAGVALMGQARGLYTFFSHLKWSWAIAAGYAASVYMHYLVNS